MSKFLKDRYTLYETASLLSNGDKGLEDKIYQYLYEKFGKELSRLARTFPEKAKGEKPAISHALEIFTISRDEAIQCGKKFQSLAPHGSAKKKT